MTYFEKPLGMLVVVVPVDPEANRAEPARRMARHPEQALSAQ